MKFRCPRHIEKADGIQEFELEADDLVKAKALFKQGKGELVYTECEVTHLSEYELESIYEIEPEEELDEVGHLTSKITRLEEDLANAQKIILRLKTDYGVVENSITPPLK